MTQITLTMKVCFLELTDINVVTHELQDVYEIKF